MSDPKYMHIGTVEVRCIEECSELIQAISKAQRFGWGSSHPRRLSSDNIKETLSEIVDVERTCKELKEKLSLLRPNMGGRDFD